MFLCVSLCSVRTLEAFGAILEDFEVAPRFQSALTLLLEGVRRKVWYLGLSTHDVDSISGILSVPNLYLTKVTRFAGANASNKGVKHPK